MGYAQIGRTRAGLEILSHLENLEYFTAILRILSIPAGGIHPAGGWHPPADWVISPANPINFDQMSTS